MGQQRGQRTNVQLKNCNPTISSSLSLTLL